MRGQRVIKDLVWPQVAGWDLGPQDGRPGAQEVRPHPGAAPRSGWAVDPFGHSPTMAYLLRRANLTSMLVQRVHYAIKKHFAATHSLEFMWRQAWGKAEERAGSRRWFPWGRERVSGTRPLVAWRADQRALGRPPKALSFRLGGGHCLLASVGLTVHPQGLSVLSHVSGPWPARPLMPKV